MMHIINCEGTRQMREKLVETYENKNETNKYFLQQKWFILGRDSSDDIATHISKVQELAQKFKTLGGNISDESYKDSVDAAS